MSEHIITSSTTHKELKLTMRDQSGSSVELGLEECEITYATDLDTNKSSVTISWDIPKIGMSLDLTPEGDRALKRVVANFVNQLNTQEREDGAGKEKESD